MVEIVLMYGFDGAHDSSISTEVSKILHHYTLSALLHFFISPDLYTLGNLSSTKTKSFLLFNTSISLFYLFLYTVDK